MPGLKYIIELGAELAPSATAAFGGVTAEIDQTKASIKALNVEQRDLTRRMRGVEQGTDEYRELERQLADVERRSARLNQTLQVQERRLRTVNRVSRASGRIFAANTAALGAFAAAMVLTTNRVGQYSRELLTANRTTGLSVEYLQTLQRQAQATGRDLDFQGLSEVAIRFGEAVAEGTGPASEALARLGFDARTVAITDIPAVIAAIRQLETDAARRFEFDEIFGGSEGETLADIANLPPETLNRIAQLNTLSAESAQRFADQKDRLDALNISFQHSTANVAGAFLPVMEDLSDTLLPVIEGFGDWAANNEQVVRGLLASAVATTALVGGIFAITKATTILNAALAVRAALSGPAGWAALGVAAAVGVGAYAISGGFSDQADGAEQDTSRLADAQQETADLLRSTSGPGSAPQPVRDRDLISKYGDDKERLENILSGLDCEISRLKEGAENPPEMADGSHQPGMIERLVEQGVPGNVPRGTSAAVAAVRSEQQNRASRGFYELREAVRAAPSEDQQEIAERYGDIEDLSPDMQAHLQRVLETRATLRGEPSTVGRYASVSDSDNDKRSRREPLDQRRLPPHLRNVPFAERGEFQRIQGASQYSYGGAAGPSVPGVDGAPRLDLEAGAVGSQNGMMYGPQLAEGMPPRVQAGAQYSRGDTSNTFYIDGSDDPEMTAAAVLRQLNRQADQDYW